MRRVAGRPRVTSQRDVTCRPTSRRLQITARISLVARGGVVESERNVLNWRYRPFASASAAAAARKLHLIA